ncbi:hypothetical protein [Rhizobium sp. BK491]|uniref:GNAT family N-acetyltransferase n=1 Tax=Rhizobium sp. BK491 TaxID=2587009 RepID=UPI0016128653|nr:hypothetical protein [Rhizobium sp. BK491]MBB3571562.1 hypothetical protein [Rhizobium sp. BK491]
MENASVHGAEHAADAHALDRSVLSSVEDQDVRAERVKPGIVIRLPHDGDWRALHELVRKVHERTVFSHIPFSDRKYAAIEAQARNPQPHQCLLVADVAGRVVGLAWFSAGEYLLGEGTVLTTTHLLGIDSEFCGPFRAAKVFVKLLRGVAAWSKTRGAHQILVHVTTGYALKQTDRLIRAGGGVCIGGSYLVKA